MTKVLVDTDVLIEHLRGRPPIADQFKAVFTTGFTVFYSPIAKAELYSGIRKGEEAATANLFRLMEAVIIDDKVGEKAGEYLRQYRASHNVQLGDALQAACAFVFHIPLWTLNKKHYPMKDVQLFRFSRK